MIVDLKGEGSLQLSKLSTRSNSDCADGLEELTNRPN